MSFIFAMLDCAVSRLFFRASHHYIPSRKDELMLEVPWGVVQVWREYHLPRDALPAAVQLCVLRFLGSRGRAEMATLDPVDRLPDVAAEVWTMNAPGFGKSTGPVSLYRYAEAARIVGEALRRHAANRPVWVTGKSLGTAAALRVGAQGDIAGLVLRNPMPLRELMRGRYGWWNLWLPSALAAQQVPAMLDSINNARLCRCPALVVMSRQDRLVPHSYQQRVIDSFSHAVVCLHVAGGHDMRALHEPDEVRYRAALARLWEATKTPNVSKSMTSDARGD